MTAFDAHLRPEGELGAWGDALATMRARPGMVLATVVAAATIVCLALLALIAGQELQFQVARSADDLQATVFLRPQTSRAAAEALKNQLDALPFVRDASLRTKEAAIATLEAGGLPQPNRANPLPDVWVVTLGLGGPADTATSLSGRVAEARRSLAELPDVESVDVDAEWLATLERWQALSSSGFRSGLVILFPLVWLLTGCLFFVAGRGLAGPTSRIDRAGPGGWSAAIVGVFIGAGTLLASAALAATVAFSANYLGADWKPIAVRVGQMSGAWVTALGVSVFLLSVLMASAAGRER